MEERDDGERRWLIGKGDDEERRTGEEMMEKREYMYIIVLCQLS